MNQDKKKYFKILDSIDFNKIKEHPNILIAAHFWEEERYCAAKICYRFLRVIDDMIDDFKAKNQNIPPECRQEFKTSVDDWLKMIVTSVSCNPQQKELIDTIEKYRIPLWPMEAFARSMIYDINHDGFRTMEDFLDYSTGATVAPAAIFVHLNGLKKNHTEYIEPVFDVKEAATPCAVFSYIVHIIRDFQKDQLNNLNYFADDVIHKNGLSRAELRRIALGAPVSDGFRNLITEYYQLADRYRLETSAMISRLKPVLEPRHQLSLEIIFSLYLLVYEKIDPVNGNFTAGALNPTPDETKARVSETIRKFQPAFI